MHGNHALWIFRRSEYKGEFDLNTIRLYCFPHAGGSALYFSKWTAFFRKDIMFEPVKYPARETRISEEMPCSLQELAEDFVRTTPGITEGPFAFFGHSMGASVAYEAARLVREKYGVLPVCMFVSGADAPGTMKERFGEELHDVSVRDADDDAFLKMVRSMGGINELLLQSQDFLDYFLPIIRRDMILCEDYVASAREQMECRMICLHGKDDHFIRQELLGSWQAYTKYPLSVQSYSGDHFYIENHVEELSALMQDTIHSILKEKEL